MKPLILLPFVMAFTAFMWPANRVKTQKSSSVSTTELTDRPGVVFARNLLDWRGRPVDSIMMDMYYPTGATSNKKYPVIIYCHGGGFSGGNRFNVMPACDRFADNGFIAVAIDYRVGYKKGKGDLACETDSVSLNEATYRACQDVNAAFRFIVAHADELNADTSALFVGGSSAGAALALQDAFLTDETAQVFYPYCVTKLGTLQTSGNNLTNTYKIKGVVSLWGGLSYADKLIDSVKTPIPTILYKGTEEAGIPDSIGNYRGCSTMPILFSAPAIHARLENQGIPSVFHSLPGGNHPAFDIEFCVENSTCFMKAIIEGRPYSGLYQYFNSSCQ